MRPFLFNFQHKPFLSQSFCFEFYVEFAHSLNLMRLHV